MHNPPNAWFKNNRSALTHRSFVSNEIERLVSQGLVEECALPPKIVNPLSVAINSEGKERWILDLKFVNFHLFEFSVKYEGVSKLKFFLEKFCFFDQI